MLIIIISGTPGTGKTSVSRKLSQKINAKVLSLNEIAIKKNFVLEYDAKRDTHITDFDKLIPDVIKLVDQYRNNKFPFLIIESHFSDMLPEAIMDHIFVLRCDPDELYLRLKKRGYSEEKIKENIQAEILGNCTNFFIQKEVNIPILEIDTTHLNVQSVANIIIDIVVHHRDSKKYVVGKIDWLQKIYDDDSLAKKYFY